MKAIVCPGLIYYNWIIPLLLPFMFLYCLFCAMQVPTPPPQSCIWLVPCLLLPLSPLLLRCRPISTPVPTLQGVMLPTLPWLSRILPSAPRPMACFLTMTPSSISKQARLCFPLHWPSIISLPPLWARLCLSSPPLTAQPRSQPPTSCNPSSVCYPLPCLPLMVPHNPMGPQFSQALLKELFSVNVVWSNTTKGLPAAMRSRSNCPIQITPYRGTLALAVKRMCPTSRTRPVRPQCPAALPQEQIPLKGSVVLHNPKQTQ